MKILAVLPLVMFASGELMASNDICPSKLTVDNVRVLQEGGKLLIGNITFKLEDGSDFLNTDGAGYSTKKFNETVALSPLGKSDKENTFTCSFTYKGKLGGTKNIKMTGMIEAGRIGSSPVSIQ